MSDWMTIATYLDRESAEIAKGLLESAGIPAQVKADDMGGNRPYLGFGPGVRLTVERRHQVEAKQILEEVELKSERKAPPAHAKAFIRAQTLCLLSLVVPLLPNVVSLYLMYKHRPSMLLEKGTSRYALLVLLNGLLLGFYGLVLVLACL
ncbi:MAG: DUF2007 domain-containing protein [Pseudobdellovibrionaceae bacterium]|nr:DUF2007 domain-containing protein [Pseudobdellovibrionaceae bacterium]